ncbi:MAG: methyltransferase domain-containing protein [Proteobacteria bacterium]|nr:methyltransferase domain-containing protein [Pseudomonadota bacterium]
MSLKPANKEKRNLTGKKSGHPFAGVDSHEDPSFWVDVLDKLHREPFYIAYKKRVREILKPKRNGIYLDIGAGTGTDAQMIANTSQANTVAFDLSLAMMLESRRRGSSTSIVGDAVFLPFADNVFDGCWSDRTFQHLANPSKALYEIVRVTKPGGTIVTVDPDYDTQVMNFPDQTLARQVFRFRADVGLQNGALAHSMAGMFANLGLTDIQMEARTLIVRDPSAVDNVMGLRSWAKIANSVRCLSGTEVQRWENLFDETVDSGSFMYSVTFFISSAVKPQ